MKIGDEVYVHGYVDEIRYDDTKRVSTIIIRNDGGYFGTVPSEITLADRKTEPQIEKCPFDDSLPCGWVCTEYGKCKYKPKTEPQTMYYPQVDGITPSVIVKTEPQTDCSWK